MLKRGPQIPPHFVMNSSLFEKSVNCSSRISHPSTIRKTRGEQMFIFDQQDNRPTITSSITARQLANKFSITLRQSVGKNHKARQSEKILPTSKHSNWLAKVYSIAARQSADYFLLSQLNDLWKSTCSITAPRQSEKVLAAIQKAIGNGKKSITTAAGQSEDTSSIRRQSEIELPLSLSQYGNQLTRFHSAAVRQSANNFCCKQTQTLLKNTISITAPR